MTSDDHRPTEADHPSQPEALQRYRSDIEDLDRRILHLVGERLDLAKQIGRLKSRTRAPLRNFEVEAEVHRRFADGCSTLGIDQSVGHDLALFLIQKSVEEQASFLDAVWDGDHLRCLVIGGKGGMGRWITRFLQSQGHEVTVYDTDPTPSPVTTVEDLATAAGEAELILVATPMSVCGDLLETLATLNVTAVVAEMCSFKGHLLERMERLRQEGLHLVSIHPLFGPDATMLSERTIVLCTEGSTSDRALVRRLFESTSAKLVELDIAEHDRRMGLVLGLTHLSNLAFARALSHSDIDASELAMLAGVTFQKQVATTHEVCRENPSLYYQIQAFNPGATQAVEWLVQAIEDFAETVRQERPGAFEALMLEGRDYLDGQNTA